jgi:BolA protein
MLIKNAIQTKLTEGLSPVRLLVEDQSHRHQGHAGANPEGESHFHVEIISAAFTGKSQIARQRLVYGLLAEELKTRVHALSLRTLAPDESGA